MIYYYSGIKKNYAIYFEGQKGERGPVGEKGSPGKKVIYFHL
jgi:hypothetical protein